MPDWKDEIKRRLRGLQVSPVNEAEIVEELAQHLDDVYQRVLRNGASEENARRAALSELNAEHSLLNELASVALPMAEARSQGSLSEPPLIPAFLQ